MINEVSRKLLDELWSGLEAERTSGERALRAAELPIDTVNGPLAVAVDHEGHRHLLVPITVVQNVRSGVDGSVLALRKRVLEDSTIYQRYADLGCLRTDLNDVFTALCADVAETAREFGDNPLKALHRVIDRWRALFRSSGAPLGSEQPAGLFGELLVLARLLEVDAGAHRLWRGPFGHRHDFASDRAAVEVKTMLGAKHRRVRIHGLDQLEAPRGGALLPAWFQLEPRSEDGEGILDLINRVLWSCDDESAVLALLARAGYRPPDDEHYRGFRCSGVEERWYAIDEAFPKLTYDRLVDPGVAEEVSEIAYTIDLSNEPPSPIPAESVPRNLEQLVRGMA